MANHSSSVQKVDRRIQRTEQLLRDALIALILEKGYDAITVQDILDRANMGRSTFYAHYRDKEDLLLSGFHGLFDAFQEEYRKTAPAHSEPAQMEKDFSLFFFRHAGSQRDLFRAMIGEQGGKIIQDHLLKYVTQYFRGHLASQFAGQNQKVPVDLLAYFIASSYLSLLIWWLDHDLPYSAEEMDQLFQRLIFPGLHEVITAQPPS